MKTICQSLVLLGAALASTPVAAQSGHSTDSTRLVNVFTKTVTAVRPYDARGINVFEMPKPDIETFKQPTLDIGAAFTQAFQSITHTNTAAPRLVGGRDQKSCFLSAQGSRWRAPISSSTRNSRRASSCPSRTTSRLAGTSSSM